MSSVSKLLRGLIIVIINKCQFDTFAINQAALFQFNHGCVGIQNPGTSPALLAGEPGCGSAQSLTSFCHWDYNPRIPIPGGPQLLGHLPGALIKLGGTEAPPSIPQQR